MSNLIVAILSVGIAAVALLMGSDYISTFYQRAQARAKAQTWVTEAAQITIAARQAGNLSTTGDDWTSAGTASLLKTAYLSDLPRHNGAYVFQPCYITGGNTTCPRYETDATLLMASVESAAVCEEIQMLANRNDVTLVRYTTSLDTSGYQIAVNAAQQFGCAWFDLDGDSVRDATPTDAYYFLHRVFMER